MALQGVVSCNPSVDAPRQATGFCVTFSITPCLFFTDITVLLSGVDVRQQSVCGSGFAFARRARTTWTCSPVIFSVQ